MGVEYVTVAESNEPDADSEEFELEADNSLLMSTLRVRYPTATGLRYRNSESNSFRALKVQDDRILPPNDETGWKDRLFFIMLPKGLPATETPDDATSARKRQIKDEMMADDYDDVKRARMARDSASANQEAFHHRNRDETPVTDLLVRGLPNGTTDEEVHKAFSTFGQLHNVEVKRNKKVERPRDTFAFIRFHDREVQREVLLMREHHLLGTTLTVKRADMKNYPDGESLRLFITKLVDGPDLDSKLQKHFSQFGKITDLYIPRKTFRGYGFVTYEMSDSVLEALDEGEHHVLEDGTRIVVTMASPRNAAGGGSAPPGKARGGFRDMAPSFGGMSGPPLDYGGMSANRNPPLSGFEPSGTGASGDMAHMMYSLLQQVATQVQPKSSSDYGNHRGGGFSSRGYSRPRGGRDAGR